MTDAIRSYLLSVVAVSLLSAILLALVPNGPIRRAATFVCGLILILVCLSPFRTLDLSALAQSISRLTMQEDAARTGVQVNSREITAELIKQKCEAYILDKAASMGLHLQAEVILETDSAYPYPSSVRITGALTAEQKRALEAYIEANLAVPAASQEWINE